MGKLFNLKEWLTVADAARHLSIVFGEDVTVADVLRLGLDGRLRLSVYFVNHAKVRYGKIVRYSESELQDAIATGNLPQDLKWHIWPPGAMALLRPDLSPEDAKKETVMLMSLRLDHDRYLTLDDAVMTISGVWDLPMLGNERLDIEHQYQQLTGGPAVTLQGLDGAFVSGRNGQVCQLQDSFAESEKGARATGADRYFPAGGLPEDGVIVVRTEALREFEELVVERGRAEPANGKNQRLHVSDKLAKMNQASEKFWANARPDDRGTHPTNAIVAAWLAKYDFSPTLADKAATIIRPEWAPAGRKPEE